MGAVGGKAVFFDGTNSDNIFAMLTGGGGTGLEEGRTENLGSGIAAGDRR